MEFFEGIDFKHSLRKFLWEGKYKILHKDRHVTRVQKEASHLRNLRIPGDFLVKKGLATER